MRSLFVYILLAILILSTTTASAQKQITGSKTYITKDVSVGSFNHISVLGSPDLIYTQTNGGSPKIEIYGSDNLVPLIEVDVENNTLVVKYKKNTSFRNGKIEVRVSAPAVESMKIQGSGDINIPNGFSAQSLRLSVSGSGDIDGMNIACDNLVLSVSGSGDIDLKNVKATNIEATVSGSGDIDLSGTSVNAKYKVSGAGDVSAVNLKTENVEANVSGSGDITCYAEKILKGKVSGSGDVGYKGNPEISFSKKGLKKL